jgi:hypothetical protein
MSGVLHIHFDGDIATNHQVSMRTLGKTLQHLQNSVDRAYLEQKNGRLWKYAKMRNSYYVDVELLVQEPREGGYILDFLTSNPVTIKVLDRVNSAIANALQESQNQGLAQASKVESEISDRIVQIEQGLISPKSFNDILSNPDPLVVRRYGDRAISREIDQVLSLIRSSASGDSTLELKITGSQNTQTYSFDKATATRFHNTVTEKSLGEPVLYKGKLSVMDRHNKSAKILNVDSNSIANLYFSKMEMFESALTYFDKDVEFMFYGSPFIEYGAFDPNAGDIHFLGLYDG